MGMDAKDYGVIRSGGVPVVLSSGDRRLEVDIYGNQYSNGFLPERASIVMGGLSWVKCTDEVACVTAIPTTTAPHTFWNGGSNAIVIDRITWENITSAGAASMFAMLGMINIAGVVAQPTTADTATGVTGLNGKAYTGSVKSSHTVTVVNDQWFPLGTTFHSGALTGTTGINLEAQINGLIVLRPGGLFSVAVIAVNTTAKGKVSLFWHEVPYTVV